MCFLRPEKHKDGAVGAGLCGGGVWRLRMAADYPPAAHVASPPWPRCWWTSIPVPSGPLLSAVCSLSFPLPISPLSVEVFRFYFNSLHLPPPFFPLSHTPWDTQCLSALVVFPHRSPPVSAHYVQPLPRHYAPACFAC